MWTLVKAHQDPVVDILTSVILILQLDMSNTEPLNPVNTHVNTFVFTLLCTYRRLISQHVNPELSFFWETMLSSTSWSVNLIFQMNKLKVFNFCVCYHYFLFFFFNLGTLNDSRLKPWPSGNLSIDLIINLPKSPQAHLHRKWTEIYLVTFVYERALKYFC